MDKAQMNGMAKEGMKDLHQVAGRASAEINKAVNSSSSDVQEIASQGYDFLKDSIEDVRKTAKKALDISQDTMKRNPVYTLLGAVAVGALVGAWLSRSRK